MSEKFTIEIMDVGPITEHTLVIEPGVTVITGQNEVGKSTAILATAALAGRKEAELTVRDGAKNGMVQGLGTTLLIGKRTTRAGELEVDSVEDRIDLSALVDPGLKQPAAATKKRIKALISLTGTKLDIADFGVILPDGMQEELILADADEDPVDMAGKIKRRMEGRARQEEEKARDEETKALGAKGLFEGIDLTAPSDQAKLQDAYGKALEELGGLKSQVQAMKDREREIASAKQTLATAEEGGPKLQEAYAVQQKNFADLQAATKKAAEADERVNAMQREVDEAIRRHSQAKLALSAAAAALDAANKVHTAQAQVLDGIKRETAHLEELRKLADAVAPEAPSDDDLAAAQEAADQAYAAIELASKVRDGLKAKEVHDRHRSEQSKHLETANVFRAAAAATDEVLSNAVAAKTLKVIEGELCYVEGKRSEPYARLSDGKRYQVAITEISRAIHETARRLAVIPLQQQAWEGLDAANRKVVADTARECNICVVTAEAGEGPLSSHVYQG